MQPIRTVKGFDGVRDEEGRVVFGDPGKGCPFCGQISIKVAENGKAIWYHSPTDCCTRMIAFQAQKKQRS